MNELYDQLMALIVPNDFSKFFFKDFVTPFGTNIRIFSYNYASYEDWIKPGALECRGITFEMKDGEPVKILARPMEKFFNLDETPFTMGLDLSTIEYGLVKEDGSLISTFEDQGSLRVKSKGSIFSTQAFDALQVLMDYNYKDLHDRCLELAKNGFTCNFEYVSPSNRIVIAYPEKTLVLLNVRENETGEYVAHGALERDPVLRRYLVEGFTAEPTATAEEMIENIRGLTNTEGCVFVMQSGLRFKLKTYWYSNLHRVKDTLNNNEALFATVVAGGSDDIKSLFDDEWSHTKITAFETVFFSYLNKAITVLNEYHAKNKGTDRKGYAINAQLAFNEAGLFELFSISMMLYTGRLDQENMVKEINKVFMKNCAKYVPEEYLVTKVDVE